MKVERVTLVSNAVSGYRVWLFAIHRGIFVPDSWMFLDVPNRDQGWK